MIKAIRQFLNHPDIRITVAYAAASWGVGRLFGLISEAREELQQLHADLAGAEQARRVLLAAVAADDVEQAMPDVAGLVHEPGTGAGDE